MINATSGAAATVFGGICMSFVMTGWTDNNSGTVYATQASSVNAKQPAKEGEEPDEGDRRTPVLHVTSVEILRSVHGDTLDIIRVRGLASSSGWEEAELIPLTKGVPADGILEMVFVAQAPAESMEATGFEPIEAIFPLETHHPFRGVNVHSASQSLTVMQMPGYAETKAPAEDCSKCVGKTLVAKGASIPVGKSIAEVVKEEQLPVGTHVIKSTDGIRKMDSNPNRLTLVLNKDGKITTAIWD